MLDFACGSGSLLLNVRKKVAKAGGTIGKIFGQERNITTYNLARMNMLLHGVKDTEFEIFHGDIDTVIGLPANLFSSTGIPVCILVLNKCRKAIAAAKEKHNAFLKELGLKPLPQLTRRLLDRRDPGFPVGGAALRD